MLVLMQPRTHLVFWPTTAHCWIIACLVELLVDQDSEVFSRAALSPFSAQPVFALWVVLTQVQDLVLGHIEVHEVHMYPPLWPAEASVDNIPSLQWVEKLLQKLGVTGRLSEGALNPIVHVTDNVEQCWSQY